MKQISDFWRRAADTPSESEADTPRPEEPPRCAQCHALLHRRRNGGWQGGRGCCGTCYMRAWRAKTTEVLGLPRRAGRRRH